MNEKLLVNGKPIDYSPLPDYMRDGMRLYMEHGIEPGGFLTAVLCNDLMTAAGAADSTNRHLLFEYTSWLYNRAPPSSYGSSKRVKAWIESYAAQRERRATR